MQKKQLFSWLQCQLLATSQLMIFSLSNHSVNHQLSWATMSTKITRVMWRNKLNRVSSKKGVIKIDELSSRLYMWTPRDLCRRSRLLVTMSRFKHTEMGLEHSSLTSSQHSSFPPWVGCWRKKKKKERCYVTIKYFLKKRFPEWKTFSHKLV